MSSGHALTPPKDPGLYTWTKQTLAILVENLRRDYPEYCIKATFLGPVDTPLAHVGLTEAAVEDKKKIMHSATYVADKIAHLIDSDKNDLLFVEAKWDYRFA
jgi:short-subunit dehydrogenase